MVNSSEFRPSTKLKALKAIEHVKSFLVLTMIALALTVIPLSPPVSAQPLNSWSSTTSYPTGIASTGIASQSCATNSGFIYCVGGTSPSPTSAVYFAPITSSGVGPWTLSAFPYGAPAVPTGVPIERESCVTNSGFIYCVGGFDGSMVVSDVFFAPISSSGVGPWASTTPYGSAPTVPAGVPIAEQSCVTDSGFIYCVGGGTNLVFFAPISSSGVGTWTSTNSYPFPIFEQSCVTRASLIYCVGGNSGTSAVFFG